MMYLLVSQQVSGIIMPIIRRTPIATSAHGTTPSPRVCCSTASAVHHRRCRLYTDLLMMGMMMPETCSDTNKYIIFSASGCLFIHLQVKKVMYGEREGKFCC
jgi:hypothetical protein